MPDVAGPIRLTVGWVYPSALSTYGDRGNVIALLQRARWRGIRAVAVRIDPMDPIPKGVDVFVLGGGQDRAQADVAEMLTQVHGPEIRRRLDDGAMLLAVCAGYQLLGHEYVTAQGQRLPGVGVFDVTTRASPARLVGEVRLETRWGEVVGFENHSGRTYLGAGVEPLGHVVSGHGNNGEDGTEGAVCGGALGSYLHGALLPRNPVLTDWLLAESRRRRGDAGELPALSNEFEQATHEGFGRRHRVGRSRRCAHPGRPGWVQRIA